MEQRIGAFALMVVMLSALYMTAVSL